MMTECSYFWVNCSVNIIAAKHRVNSCKLKWSVLLIVKMRSYLEGIFAANVIFRSYRCDSVAGQRNATQNRLFTTVCGWKTIQLSNKSGCDCVFLFLPLFLPGMWYSLTCLSHTTLIASSHFTHLSLASLCLLVLPWPFLSSGAREWECVYVWVCLKQRLSAGLTSDNSGLIRT